MFKVITVSKQSLNFFKNIKLDRTTRPPKECPIRDIFKFSYLAKLLIYIFISLAKLFPYSLILFLVLSSFSSDKTNTVLGLRY